MHPARTAIQRILVEAGDLQGGLRLSPLVEAEASRLAAADGRLVREVVLGVHRNRLLLDRMAEALSRRGRRPPPQALAGLRAGLYQLLFLHRLPPFAVVDGTVAAVASRGGRRLAGMVNACLRLAASRIGRGEAPSAPADRLVRVEREGETVWLHWPDPLLPDPSTDREGYLAVRYSHPRLLVRRWSRRWEAAEVEGILRAGTLVPATHLRVQRLRASREEVARRLAQEGYACEEAPHPWCLRLVGGGVPVGSAAFREGLCTVQDPSALAAVDLLAPLPGERVLDLCAAPGGKATALAEAMGDQGEVVAWDADRRRLARVEEAARRLGLRSVRLAGGDPLAEGPFHRVLLDVPCSNTGVLARRVEARWRFTAARLGALVEVQKRLLAQGLGVLRPGGGLVYATCSLEFEENDGLLGAALGAPWRLASASLLLPRPPLHDGGFAARIDRVEDPILA